MSTKEEVIITDGLFFELYNPPFLLFLTVLNTFRLYLSYYFTRLVVFPLSFRGSFWTTNVHTNPSTLTAQQPLPYPSPESWEESWRQVFD